MPNYFRTYLADTVQTEEKRRPYYIKWVSAGYSFLKAELNNSLSDASPLRGHKSAPTACCKTGGLLGLVRIHQVHRQPVEL